jgi:hypothetical protein
MEPFATGATACYFAVHNVDSSFPHHRPAEYAQAKRRTLNSKDQKPEEGLHQLEAAVETRIGSPVLNRPPNRDSFNSAMPMVAFGRWTVSTVTLGSLPS